MQVRTKLASVVGCEVGSHAFLNGHDIENHLRPSSFLDSLGYHTQGGDSLRVTGSTIAVRGASLLLARALHGGDRSVVLRDTDVRPLWGLAEALTKR